MYCTAYAYEIKKNINYTTKKIETEISCAYIVIPEKHPLTLNAEHFFLYTTAMDRKEKKEYFWRHKHDTDLLFHEFMDDIFDFFSLNK